jgi:pimeloyl-ACP methyl ester carboxylesterase
MKTTANQTIIQGEALATVLFEPDNHIADVLLVHGFTGSKEDFTEIAELMAKVGYRVLTFDHRGQHESSHSKRADAYSMESLGRDVIELSKSFGLEKPHLLGHSFGGLIVQEAFTQAPEMWRSITLMCSGPGGKNDWGRPEALSFLRTRSMESIWNEFFDEERKTHPRYAIHKKRWIASDGISTATYRDHLEVYPSRIGEIAKTGIPAHVIYGESDDAWPLALQNQMAKDLNAKLTVLPGCGHCPNEDNPQLNTDALVSFWKSV